MYVNYAPVNKNKRIGIRKNKTKISSEIQRIDWWLTEVERWRVGKVRKEGQKVLREISSFK